jgi:hydrogenase expression/formation protein HypE
MNCPIPKTDYDRILLAHGSGGKLTRQLIESVILPQLHNPLLADLADGATIDNNLVFTTDGYVVSPLFFEGGDIGELAVNGTINDLVVSGADPVALSLALIIEEGFSMKLLDQVIKSVARASRRAGVPIATGDTKVVDRGKCDQIYIVTSGIGYKKTGANLHPNQIKPGDAIVINGSIGDHGIAVMAARDHLEFSTPASSDTAPLHQLVSALTEYLPSIHCMRDPTRGGVAAVANEIAKASGFEIVLNQSALPINDTVMSACELLGLDPIHIANEGKVIVFVEADTADIVVAAMRKHPLGKASTIIGYVGEAKTKRVIMNTTIGTTRIIHEISGEQLPRIC